MVYVAALKVLLKSAEMTIHPTQIAWIAALKQDEAPTKVPSKYADYADVFSFDLAMKLLENTGINEQAIKLEKGKRSSYRLINSLGPVELETLKTYIKTYLKTGFI